MILWCIAFNFTKSFVYMLFNFSTIWRGRFGIRHCFCVVEYAKTRQHPLCRSDKISHPF